jgi:hypothetical protein
MKKGKIAQGNALHRVQIILRSCLLRRTKTDTLDGEPLVTLPEKNITLDGHSFSTDEQEFYDILFKRAKMKFNKFVKAGTVMKNYSSILTLLLRLRQAGMEILLIYQPCIQIL